MTLDEFFTEVCRAFGWQPTPWRLAVFNFWAEMEGITGRLWANGHDRLEFHWNPLATTLIGRRNMSIDLGYGPGKWNNANGGRGVGIYADAWAGIEATVTTLKGVASDGTPHYANILRCFEDQTGYAEAVKPRDFMTWVGYEAYGTAMVSFMNSATASKEMPGGPSDEEAIAAIVRRVISEESIEVDDRLRSIMQKRVEVAGVAYGPVEALLEAHDALRNRGLV